ncbi:hypothetical protein DE146DRAFT_760445 [Phaeosphaeria sp. MPI-PUGE-AT-0046c]|nr:hypothetical protein DE146DRAFT_760445 [Phaeosphaeria sp. MPI-PUGE-AT-0046c]
MGILTHFTSPQDVRWQGSHRTHHLLFLIKSILLVPFIILVIVEYPLFKSWWENGPGHTRYDWYWAPYQFWPRIGMALIPDVIVTVASLVLILNPMNHATYSFHPVFALVSSFIVMALYVQVCWLNPLIALSNEVAFYNSDVWKKIVYAETAFEGIICILYIAMLVYSCIAVHKWRMAKKSGSVYMDRPGRDEVGWNTV